MLWRLFHSCKIQKYRRNDDTWAVVTGASDGIGKCLADDLLSRGFNVIVHGRSREKVAKVVAELQAKHPTRKVESVLADMTRLEDVSNLTSAVEKKKKKLTIFIHNAAPTDREYHLFMEMPYAQIERSITVGVVFTTKLIREVLPMLVANGPSVLINIGSQSAQVATPYVSVYSAAKGFLLSFTNCLAVEARLVKAPIEIMYSDVHSVNSATNHVKPNLISPSSETCAKAILDSIGCGYTFVTPYWAHEFARYWTYVLPQVLLDKFADMSITAIRTATEEWERRSGSRQKAD